MYHQHISAMTLSRAATQQYSVMLPAHRIRIGNTSELANEPNAPAVFIAADSVPE